MCRSVLIGAAVGAAILIPVMAILDYAYFQPPPDSAFEVPESAVEASWHGIIVGMLTGSMLGGMSGAATCAFATLIGLRKAHH